MNKIQLAALLLFLLAAITGCRAKAEPQQAAERQDASPHEDYYEVVMTISTTEQDSPDLYLVQEEINKIAMEEIGVRVRLLPLEGSSSAQTGSLMLASNEKLDLMLINRASAGQHVARGQILPLDDLLAERGRDIRDALGIILSGGYYGGALYAVPAEEKMGRSYGIAARTDLLEEYGFSRDNISSYRDLEPLFDAVLEHNPGMVPLSCRSGLFANFYEIDTLGATLASGGLLDGGRRDTTVVNVFSTPEYAAFLEDMYRWNQRGYIDTEVVTSGPASMFLVQSGDAFSYPMSTELGMEAGTTNSVGLPMTCLPLTRDFATTSMYQVSLWAIPSTSENPEKAMEFLNLTFKDERIVNLLSNGIEGLHYEKTEHPMIIRRPEGVTPSNSGYEMPGYVFGNKMLKYSWEPTPPDIYQQTIQFNANVIENEASVALGYVFDTSAVHSELSLITSVMDEYQTLLETGCVNPQNILPEFLAKLELAGIDQVIAENQRQLDLWLEEQQM